ncbi:MAG: ribosome maturation factor RimP [Rhodospirillales bacterium]
MATSEAGLSREIEHLIAPSVEEQGYSIVRVQLMGQKEIRLQVMIERRDLAPMQVEDCAGVSRAISLVLDAADPIRGAYALEVSSPGIDRPLTREGDFDRFAGLQARIEMTRAVEGRKRFRGTLLGIENGIVRMDVDGTERRLPFADIGRAKLVVTDELLAAAEERPQQENGTCYE